MPRYYARLGVAALHENLPGSLSTPLMHDAKPVNYLSVDGTLVPLPRYMAYFDQGNDEDYQEIRVVSIQTERPADFNQVFLEDSPRLIGAWAVIDTDGTVTPPDPDEGDPGGGGDGGVKPPPVEPEPPADRYMGRWSDHWTDSDGLIHYYPQSGGFTELYPVIHQQTLKEIERVLIAQTGSAEPNMFKAVARMLGIESSASDSLRVASLSLTAQAAFERMLLDGLNVADHLTMTDDNGRFAGSHIDAARSFWAMQSEARDVFAAAMSTDNDLSLLSLDAQSALLDAMTSHKVFVSLGYNRDVIEDRGYFVALETGTGWVDVRDAKASVIGAITSDLIHMYARGSAVLGPGDDQFLQLSGDSGSVVFGGGGDDFVKLSGADQPDLISHVEGGAGRDRLSGSDFDDRFFGESGQDRLLGYDGRDTLDGGRGEDLLRGGLNKDLLFGGRGDDVLTGDGGRDNLQGGRGDDILYGGKSNDRLDGGLGNDRLYGEKGEDRFVFGGPKGEKDTIHDFSRTDDLIVLQARVAQSMADLKLSRVDSDTFTIQTLGGKITVHGSTDLTLNQDDFVFIS